MHYKNTGFRCLICHQAGMLRTLVPKQKLIQKGKKVILPKSKSQQPYEPSLQDDEDDKLAEDSPSTKIEKNINCGSEEEKEDLQMSSGVQREEMKEFTLRWKIAVNEAPTGGIKRTRESVSSNSKKEPALIQNVSLQLVIADLSPRA